MNGGRGGARLRVLWATAITGLVVLVAGRARAQFALPADFTDQLVVAGLPQAVGMAFLPDGRLLVVERATARVRLIVNGALAATDPVVTVPDVESSYGEEGLLGIAVDPGWPARPYVYVQHTVLGAPFIRIARFTAAGDLAFTGNGSIAIDPATRYDVIADAPHPFAWHNGGTLRFGPDGMLYSSLGDPTACASQVRGELLGKILRLDVSHLPPGPGGPAPRALITPADNPFVGDPNPDTRLVYQWGLRNPFRFAIDRVTGALVIGDVGGDQREELNYVTVPGRNFEWPVYEGDVPGPYQCASIDSSAFTGPVAFYDHSEGSAVIAGVLYRRSGSASEPFPPEYDGDIFYADFYAPWLRRLKGAGSSWSPAPAPGQPNATDWGSGAQWISDWLVAPDGSLWYCRMLTGNSTGPAQIRRIRYTGVVSADLPPLPGALSLRAPYPNPARGEVILEFTLAEPGEVSLAIHDLAGRRVRALIEGARHAPGQRRLQWDGRDARGAVPPAGIYRARLTMAGRTIERRLALVR